MVDDRVDKLFEKCHRLEALLEEKTVSEAKLKLELMEIKRKYQEQQK
jgi:hypothetical protein